MSPHFMSLHMAISPTNEYLTAMEVLAQDIAKSELDAIDPHPLIRNISFQNGPAEGNTNG